jgi:hypothetical protein
MKKEERREERQPKREDAAPANAAEVSDDQA